MLVKRIKLQNFRCHKRYELVCKPQTTLILGQNGCGKTSVIEAVYEVLRGKSGRAVDRDIVRRGADFYRVELETDEGDVRSVAYDERSKVFVVHGQKYRRLPPKAQYPIVLFEFRDLDLVSASPTRQRAYFDEVLGRTSPAYPVDLRRYEKALHQRNQLIKQESSPEQFFPWNILLAKHGSALRRARRQYLEMVNRELSSVYQSIARNDDQLAVKYHLFGAETAVEDDVDVDTEISNYLKQLELSAQKDLVIGHTTYGAHRDTYEFLFNGRPARGSASRGEVRSLMISLKFIEAKDIEARTHTKPLILLDDVFSELDAKRRQCLVENFRNHQIILTSTESY